MAGKEVRRTSFQSADGSTYPVVTYRYGLLKREYEVRVVHEARGPRQKPSFEIPAIGRFSSAKVAEQTGLNKIRQREERLRHY
jgi:hypothetical protein